MQVSSRQDAGELRQLVNTDPDPNVRRRAGAVLLVTGGSNQAPRTEQARTGIRVGFGAAPRALALDVRGRF